VKDYRSVGVAALACLVALTVSSGIGSGDPVGDLGRAPVNELARAGSGSAGLLVLPGGVVWASGDGQVLRSTDAGARWRSVFPTWSQGPTALHVTDAFFLNAEDAWAVTDHEWPAPPGATTIWSTTDGGARWHEGVSLPGVLTDYGPPFDQFVFADAEHGYAFGVSGNGSGSGGQSARSEVLWATMNGGQTWRRVDATGLPWQASTFTAGAGQACSEQDPFSLGALSADALVLTADLCPSHAPGVWRSDDGGRRWAPVDLPVPPGGWAVAEAWSYPRSYQVPSGAEVLGTRFFAGGAGVMAVTSRPGELLVYRSADAGATWELASTLQTGSLSRPAGFYASASSTWELAAPAGLYLTTDSGHHWVLQRSTLSLSAVTQVSFASGEMGVGLDSIDLNNPAIGLDGLRTLDGGRSWQAVSVEASGSTSAEPRFSTVEFVTASQGWVGGAGGVEASTDGGTTWVPQLVTEAPVEELSFADADYGWALTADQLFATADGGRRWSVLPEPASGALSSVQLVSASFGVALVCEAGGTRALETDDEGHTWRLLAVPRPNDLACGQPEASPGTFYGLCFGTPEVGWAVQRASGSAGAVMERTRDGGLNWSAVASLEPTPSQIACQGTTQAWVGLDWMDNMSQAGDLAGTVDGGRTWAIGKFTGVAERYAPRMTAADGMAVGALGTAAGPVNWMLPVGGLAIPGPGDVVDQWVGEGACIMGFGLITTVDGGATWRALPGETAGANPQCHSAGLPFLASGGVLPTPLSVSFPTAGDGFVLAPAAGPSPAGKSGDQPVTMALIGTTGAGQAWRLLARFAWPSAT